jgi:hypothetical protein
VPQGQLAFLLLDDFEHLADDRHEERRR